MQTPRKQDQTLQQAEATGNTKTKTPEPTQNTTNGGTDGENRPKTDKATLNGKEGGAAVKGKCTTTWMSTW
jgi:hypothetical protein